MPNHGKGGRPKGSRSINESQKQKKTREVVTKYINSGEETPLEIMLSVMKQSWAKQDIPSAMFAAKEAAPYIHAKLASTTISGNANAPFTVKIIDDCHE